MPTALVVRAAGTNCDAEMLRAFEHAGAQTRLEHIDRLIKHPELIDDVDLMGFPGGFSYGDDIASGRIFAVKLRERLYPALRAAAERGVHMIGACNGFQVLTQVGLLPGPDTPLVCVATGSKPTSRQSATITWPQHAAPRQTTALSFNSGGRFIDAWVGVRPDPSSVCVWTRGLESAFADRAGDVLQLPIAHGEGRFVAASPDVLSRLTSRGQIALRYRDNPNGSQDDIAGICDPTGRIFGLMPHPERYLDWTLHPFWTRLPTDVRRGPTPGMMMFQNAVEAAKAGKRAIVETTPHQRA
jgi:phosphoribosylformylglycinamidine synthase subunit PurQ / glutaminase